MIETDIEDLLRPTIESMGYELWGCEYLAQGKHSVLRVYIDKESGIGIEDCEQVSHQVSALLDVNDPITSHYALEVSSPGIPKPLFRFDQYQRYVGQVAHIKLFKPLNGTRKYAGEIVSVSDTTLVLLMDENQQAFLFSNIAKATLGESSK